MMCFAVLIARAIGTKRLKDDHSSQNATTSGEFFSRCPNLRSFLLEQLKLATSQSVDALHPILYPILLMLSRLRPSFTDDVNDPYSVIPFIDYVKGCDGLRHYMV